MQDLLRWLASFKGIPVEPGADLRFEFAAFPTGGLALLTLLGLVLALALVVLVYRRDGRNLTRGQRICLATLRILAVFVAFAVLLEPNLVAVKKEVREGHAIILLDLSQSMGHRDAFRREEVQDLVRAWGRLDQQDLPGRTRLDLATAVLSHEDARLIRTLSEKNQVLLYGFGSGIEEIVPLASPAEATETPADPETTRGPDGEEERPTPRFDLSTLAADGKYSNLGGAIRSSLQKSRDAAVAAVVVLTDGRRNIGAKGSEVSRFLSQRKVQHTFLLGVGDPSEAQIVSVSRIEAPERAFQKDPFKIRANVTSEGYDNLSLTVKLVQMPEGGAGAGVVVQSKPVALAGGTQDVVVEFESIRADQAGTRTYRVEIDPPEGEPLNPERHGKQARIEILEEQTKVLLIAGSPMHEYQILRQLLTRDKTIELSCWLLSSDDSFVQDGDVNLEKLPDERKELEPFDVFIFMDPDSSLLDQQFCDMVARQVEENGAGLWWVAGEKFTLDALSPTASTNTLAGMLPVIPNLDLGKRFLEIGRAFPRAYSYELTPAGRIHQMMRVEDAGTDQNAIKWSQLPGWHFTFPVTRPKPGATVLAATSASIPLREGEEPMPIVATQFYGAGRVLFSGTDEIYRWRSHYEDEYNRFWVNGIRYLFTGRLTAGSSRLRIDISAEKLELGEPLEITVEAKDEIYQPLIAATYDLRVVRENEPPEMIELRAVDGAPGRFETIYRPLRTGFFRITPVLKNDRVETGFQVIAAAIEREGPVDVAELGAIAEAKGGELLRTPTELFDAVEKIKSARTTESFRTPHALWDSWVTIAIILVLLSAEWWLRKRWNLL